jgi:hypothetical protein
MISDTRSSRVHPCATCENDPVTWPTCPRRRPTRACTDTIVAATGPPEDPLVMISTMRIGPTSWRLALSEVNPLWTLCSPTE